MFGAGAEKLVETRLRPKPQKEQALGQWTGHLQASFVCQPGKTGKIDVRRQVTLAGSFQWWDLLPSPVGTQGITRCPVRWPVINEKRPERARAQSQVRHNKVQARLYLNNLTSLGVRYGRFGCVGGQTEGKLSGWIQPDHTFAPALAVMPELAHRKTVKVLIGDQQHGAGWNIRQSLCKIG